MKRREFLKTSLAASAFVSLSATAAQPEVGLAPVFFGQALVGASLPHLTYMLSAENRDLHQKHWDVFGKHATWKRMSADPQYKDTVSTIRNTFLAPASYSQI